MADVGLPGMTGGLMRYNEEYDSKLKFGPGAVVVAIVLVVAFYIGIKIFS